MLGIPPFMETPNWVFPQFTPFFRLVLNVGNGAIIYNTSWKSSQQPPFLTKHQFFLDTWEFHGISYCLWDFRWFSLLLKSMFMGFLGDSIPIGWAIGSGLARQAAEALDATIGLCQNGTLKKSCATGVSCRKMAQRNSLEMGHYSFLKNVVIVLNYNLLNLIVYLLTL